MPRLPGFTIASLSTTRPIRARFARTLMLACSALAFAALAYGPVADAQDGVGPVKLTLTTIDVPGAIITQINGINTAGEMVGLCGQALEEAVSGFSYSNGSSTYFDYPGQAVTVPWGINDSNGIVGLATQLPYQGARSMDLPATELGCNPVLDLFQRQPPARAGIGRFFAIAKNV